MLFVERISAPLLSSPAYQGTIWHYYSILRKGKDSAGHVDIQFCIYFPGGTYPDLSNLIPRVDRLCSFLLFSFTLASLPGKKGWLLPVSSEAFLCFSFTIWKISLWKLKHNIYATNTFCMLISQEDKSHFLTFPESQGLWGIPHLFLGCSTLVLHLVFFSKRGPLRSSLIWIVLNSSNFLMSLGHCSTCVAVPPG